MNRLDRYIFRQSFVPFLVAIGVITGIVWLTQSLQRADVLIEYRRGLEIFARISLLIIPSLLSAILPFTLFAAALYSLQRLHADSEIAVMFAAGVSRARIAGPYLLLAAIAAAATLWINVDLMPRSYRNLKSEIASLRADAASAVLRGGEFTQVGDGFTIYVERADPGGEMRGLVISDYRKNAQQRLYMAQSGRVLETDRGTVLILSNGNVQRIAPDGSVDIFSFRQTTVNLDAYQRKRATLQLELTERYLGELFRPDMTSSWDRENVRALAAEGHGRLASPLYAFAYVLIALVAVTGGPYNRRTYALRLTLASVAAGGLRVLGVVLQSLAGGGAPYWAIYAPPLAAATLGAVAVAGFLSWPGRLRRGA